MPSIPRCWAVPPGLRCTEITGQYPKCGGQVTGALARAFTMLRMSAQGGSHKKVANGLVVMSSAAVLAVYAAGYVRTRSAADQFDAQTAERRPAVHETPRVASPDAEHRPSAPMASSGESPAPASTLPARVATPASHAAQDAAAQPDLIASAEPAPVANIPGIAPASPVIEAPAPSLPATSPATPVAVATQSAPLMVEHKIENKVEIAAAAPVSILAPMPVAQPAAPAASPLKDGLYYGWGTSRHGDIQAVVVIEGGRIASATIAQCLTRYSCSVISRLPPQVAQRQSPEVDYVSGATQSTNAFYYAVVEALGKAK